MQMWVSVHAGLVWPCLSLAGVPAHKISVRFSGGLRAGIDVSNII